MRSNKSPHDKMKLYGQALRNRRTSLGLTQEEAANLAGCGIIFVVQIEDGKPTVRMDKALDLMTALGLQFRLESGTGRIEVDVEPGR